ncbi:hypothetical protein ILUMI_23423 [Ignelater luminosus]|uniref:6-pyruvoyl tetrahydrobiopterin synthase n=1 Tax=Ignelater luminosus TaxID=2038154 RepID=A0A8K0C8U4_IGNLU|nr:hypothetical protein ILUMI_23423 [Ignelater luminosus]
MANTEKLYKAYLTRRTTFSAAHRLHSKDLTDDENRRIYGKCNHPNGHGHNYVVEVMLCGPVDPISGMVVNMTDLKDWIEVAVMKSMDHKNLDKDVEFFHNRPSTTENVAIFIWNSLRQIMKEPELLYEVKIYETEKNIVTFRG